MSRILAAAALVLVRAVPATSQAISIVLTPACAGCGAGATTTTSTTGVQSHDLYLDIAGLSGSYANAVYEDNHTGPPIFSYGFVVSSGVKSSFVQGPPDNSGYVNAPGWFSQAVSGTPTVASWNDFLLLNALRSPAIFPPNLGGGGGAPGLFWLGTLTVDAGSLAMLINGDPVLVIQNGVNSFVDTGFGPTAGSIPTTAILTFVPEPSVAVLLGLSLTGLSLARRREA